MNDKEARAMSDNKGKHVGVPDLVEKSFNGVSNLRPIHIETSGQGVGSNSNSNPDQGSQATQTTTSISDE